MFLKTFMKFSAMALILALSAGTAVNAADKKSGIVIQVSDNSAATWNLALNVAKNVQQDLGKDKVDVEIVAFGPGLGMLKMDSEVGPRLAAASKDGVMLSACGNTMKKTKVSEKDLHPGVKVVPAGAIEIMNKQLAGWAYIKP
jgi:intracellular sulfur oxidation DsrE/DsrF family protein